MMHVMAFFRAARTLLAEVCVRRTGLLVAMGAAGLWAACADPAFVLLPPADGGRDASVLDAADDASGDGAAPADAGDAEAAIDLEDFHVPGTQIGDVPNGWYMRPADCAPCHGGASNMASAPMPTWSASLMSVAGRDPLFFAQLTTANQDVPGVGYYCLRCHVPTAIVSGNAADPTGESLSESDKDGVTCHFCHGMVDPISKAGAPNGDVAILAALADKPSHYGNAQFVLDPAGLRRGPYPEAGALHPYTGSPFHRTAELCGTCHDVGNVAVDRVDGGYAYNAPHQRAGNPDPTAQFPLERTFTEWKQSAFAKGGVDMGGRFGGPGATVVSTCEDCHMPRENAKGCFFEPPRVDLARHDFAGASAWVLDIVALREGPKVDQAALAQGHVNAVSMLQRAATLSLAKVGSDVQVRVQNESGHKLPTGHIEGRRVFLNVIFTDPQQKVLAEHGGWSPLTGDMTGLPTTIFEMIIGLSAEAAKKTGLAEGPTTHMALADMVVKDNRIPPRGFSNATYEALGAGAVQATYADGQHWADAAFPIPAGATHVKVRLLYQTVTREYIDALVSGNKTNTWGKDLESLWLQTDRAPPIAMAIAEQDL